MRLKTFTAATMKDAIAAVRSEMGPDAIIVSAYERPRGRGVEVRAAIEGRPQPPPAPRPESPPAVRQPARAAAHQVPPAPEEPEPVRGIAQIAHRRVGTPARREARPEETVLRGVLSYHGLEAARIESLIDMARKFAPGEAEEMLAAFLDARLSFTPLPLRPRRPVMLVGAPGAGKTVTAAKLAARARLAGHAASVITTDTLRSGAIEQLSKLVAVLGIKLASASTPGALQTGLGRAAAAEITCIVDTPGTNVFSIGERRDLRHFMAAGEIEPVLVMAAGLDSAEAAEQARLFAEIGVRRFITTRLDAARRLGSLIATADEGKLAFAQVSLSPYLSEPLETLSAGALARILIAQGAAAAKTADASSPPSLPLKEQQAS